MSNESGRQAATMAEYRSRLADSTIHLGNRHRAPGDAAWVTVITICRNADTELARSIASVDAQTYPHIEYIVIDGASTDQTLAVLAEHRQCVSAWISEPDRGIADAFNKGCALARGEYIQILNADDWLDPGHLARAAAALRGNAGDALVYGDVAMHDRDDRVTRVVRGRPDALLGRLSAMSVIPHPSVLVRREVYETVGLYDTRYALCMDYDWILRVKGAGYRARHLTGLLAHMREGGRSNLLKTARDRENRQIALRHGELDHFSAWALYCLKRSLNLIESRDAASAGAGLAARLTRVKNRLLNRLPDQ